MDNKLHMAYIQEQRRFVKAMISECEKAMYKELLTLALFCAQELRAACEELKILPHGYPEDIEKTLWLMAVDAGIDLQNLPDNAPTPPAEDALPILSDRR